MTLFALENQLAEAGYDLHLLRREWKEISTERSWPINETGWRRYLQRVQDTGVGPRAPVVRQRVVEEPVPPGFPAWWQDHRHSGYCRMEGRETYTVPPGVAWRCERYRREWKEQTQPLREAA